MVYNVQCRWFSYMYNIYNLQYTFMTNIDYRHVMYIVHAVHLLVIILYEWSHGHTLVVMYM